MKSILIIDDEDRIRQLMSRILQLEGYIMHEASDIRSAMATLARKEIDLVLSDVKLPDGNGVDLVRIIKEKFPYIEIIVLTAYGTIADGVKAIKNGAFDYLTKGDDNDKILPLVSKAIDKALLQRRIADLEKRLDNKYSFENIIGRSTPIKHAVYLAEKVAGTDATVLLLGETGTGKEIFAHAIHQKSSRNLKPFVAINCSAFSKDLLESELFGHTAGAFTGALKEKKGLFEEAHTGTLFLDEIGELNIDLQAKLLRVLESGEFIKLGDSKSSKVDVRIIAATNRDLEQETENGNFRSDLFYRLSVFEIKLPSLKDRREDIELLAEYYIALFARKMKRPSYVMDSQFLQRLLANPWRGNIRELRNVIERAVILADRNTLTADLLPIEIQIANNEANVLDLTSVEKNHIQKVLHYTGGNKAEAARLLGIGLTTLYRKIEEYQLGSEA